MRDILVAVLVVAIGAGGCAGPHGHGGNVVAEYPVQSDEHQLRPVPVLGWTNVPAIYVLYARQEMPDWPDAKQVRGGWELGAWRLPKRSQLGFRPDADGGVVAVAGADETRLPPGMPPGSHGCGVGAGGPACPARVT